MYWIWAGDNGSGAGSVVWFLPPSPSLVVAIASTGERRISTMKGGGRSAALLTPGAPAPASPASPPPAAATRGSMASKTRGLQASSGDAATRSPRTPPSGMTPPKPAGLSIPSSMGLPFTTTRMSPSTARGSRSRSRSKDRSKDSIRPTGRGCRGDGGANTAVIRPRLDSLLSMCVVKDGHWRVFGVTPHISIRAGISSSNSMSRRPVALTYLSWGRSSGS